MVPPSPLSAQITAQDAPLHPVTAAALPWVQPGIVLVQMSCWCQLLRGGVGDLILAGFKGKRSRRQGPIPVQCWPGGSIAQEQGRVPRASRADRWRHCCGLRGCRVGPGLADRCLPHRHGYLEARGLWWSRESS